MVKVLVSFHGFFHENMLPFCNEFMNVLGLLFEGDR